MARKKTLPLIEDFDNIPEEALVPEDEQPYQIPEHWKWVRLGKIARFQGGGTPDKSNPAYWNGDIPWASVKDLTAPSIVNTQDHISEEGLSNSSAELCIPGDLLLATRIDPGRVAIASTAISINQDLKIVRSRLASNTYLRNWFTSIPDWFSQSASGTTVKGVTINKLNAMPLPLPPLDEQQRIVDYLDTNLTKIDDAIQRLDAFLDDFPNRRFDLVRALLAGQGLPDHGGDPKQQWETLPLGEILRVSSGRGLTAKEMNSSGNVPVYGGNGITGYHDQACYPAGTIAIGRVGFYCGSVHMSLEECWVTDNALVARFDENQIDRRFLYFLLGHTNLRINTSSSAQPLISGKKIYDIPVNIPSRDTQKAIVKHVEASLEYFDRIETLAVKSRDELTDLRALVVQQALQGAFTASPIR